MTAPVPRCEACGVPFTPDVTAHWCRWRDCPMTSQRQPTEAQRREYRMDGDSHPASREGGERG